MSSELCNATGAAFAEYGRIDKTMHLLALVDPVDDTCRRLMNRQLTVQESRHRLARAICHGGRGQIRQACREEQEEQLASLGLALNAVVCPRSRTGTSTSWAATSPTSRPADPVMGCARCAIRTRWMPSMRRNDPVGAETCFGSDPPPP